MKAYETSQIRNVALAGNSGAGKTALAEAAAWTLKVVPRMGRTEEGNTLSDYDAEETKRQCSVQAALIPVEYDGCKINLIDLPGFRDFLGEIRNGMVAAETTVLVFDATGGVEAGAEFAWSWAEEFKRPRAIFINKLDKEHSSWEKAVEAIKSGLGARLVPIALPVGAEADFQGVVDLLKMKMVVEDGPKSSLQDIPAEMKDAADAARAELIEAAAEGDDELMMKFLEEEALTPEEVVQGLKGAVIEGRIVPCLCGAAASGKGVRPLLDFIAQCAPNPTEFDALSVAGEAEGDDEPVAEPLRISSDGAAALYVFKTVSDPFVGRLNFFKVARGAAKGDCSMQNLTPDKAERIGHLLTVCGKKTEDVASLAAGDLGALAKLSLTRTGDTLIEPGSPPLRVQPPSMPGATAFIAVAARARADEDKLGDGYRRLLEQDPTLSIERDPTTHQTIVSGMGDTHLSVAISRLQTATKVEVDTELPRVAYRETITKKGEGQGKHKKQSGGHGQYGDCHIRFEPLPGHDGFEFVWEIVGGVIPTNYQSAVEKGLVQALARGVLAGCPLVGIKATCFDGSHHAVDSSDIAFQTAAGVAVRNVIPTCSPVIMEPIHKVTITVPEEYMGDVMGDLNGRRGRILGMTPAGGKQVIEAHVPLAELFTYSRQINSITQGRGLFEMEFDHFDRTPGEVQEKIIAEAKAQKEAAQG